MSGTGGHRLGRPELFFLVSQAAHRAGPLPEKLVVLLEQLRATLELSPGQAEGISNQARAAASQASSPQRFSKSQIMNHALQVALADGVLEDQEFADLLALGRLFRMPEDTLRETILAQAPSRGAPSPTPASAHRPETQPEPEAKPKPVPRPAPTPSAQPNPDPTPPPAPLPATDLPEPSPTPPPSAPAPAPPASPRPTPSALRPVPTSRPRSPAAAVSPPISPEASWTRLDDKGSKQAASAAAGGLVLWNVLSEMTNDATSKALGKILPGWLVMTLFLALLVYLLLDRFAKDKLSRPAAIALALVVGGGTTQAFRIHDRRTFEARVEVVSTMSKNTVTRILALVAETLDHQKQGDLVSANAKLDETREALAAGREELAKQLGKYGEELPDKTFEYLDGEILLVQVVLMNTEMQRAPEKFPTVQDKERHVLSMSKKLESSKRMLAPYRDAAPLWDKEYKGADEMLKSAKEYLANLRRPPGRGR